MKRHLTKSSENRLNPHWGLFEGSIIAELYLISIKLPQDNSYTVLLPLTGDQKAKSSWQDQFFVSSKFDEIMFLGSGSG